jgi:N-acetylneuraminate synthase
MTLIIAEAGVNHNGDEDLAVKLIDTAYISGADIVKFQTFNSKKLATNEAKQAEYQLTSFGKQASQLDMLSRLELSYGAHRRLVDYCSSLGIEFMSSAFDSESLDFLVSDLKLTRLKIASGELTNAPFLLEHAKTQCDLIVSTGMATLAEIETALGVLAFGYTTSAETLPTPEAFAMAYASEAGQRALKAKVILLHCTTEYPAPVDEVNLGAMNTLTSAFGLCAGYSDHTEGISIAIAATACGAVIIEKHFTLDRNLEGPDHKASLEPDELTAMIKGIRQVELALGDGIKRITLSEMKNKEVARKSIVAECDIAEGEIFTTNNIAIKRPGTGKSPYLYWEVLGSHATRALVAGELLDE